MISAAPRLDNAGARPCPACGSSMPHRLLFNVNGCDIWHCGSCGLGRAEPGAFDPASYYTREYFHGGHADGYADYLGAEPVLRREFRRTVELIRSYRPGGRLLELGCAYGFFLQEARHYFEVAGIEMAEDAAQHCRQCGLNVLQGEVDEAKLEQIGDVDVVALFDVIEHLPEPRETLALCSRHLKPGGIMVITTGDFGSALARLLGRRWRLITPPQHLWFFTVESMRRLSAAPGLTVERVDHPPRTVPLSLIVFQLRRMLGLGGSVWPLASRTGVPVNLFDSMRIVLRKPQV